MKNMITGSSLIPRPLPPEGEGPGNEARWICSVFNKAKTMLLIKIEPLDNFLIMLGFSGIFQVSVAGYLTSLTVLRPFFTSFLCEFLLSM